MDRLDPQVFETFEADIMLAQPNPAPTPEDYLAWERRQETRHEYVNGEVHAMTEASRAHNVICVNIAASLHAQLRGKPCEVYINDMRVKVGPSGIYTYPDIAVACGRPQFEDAEVDTLLNPVLIVEVLSESTEAYDRGAKFAHYRNIASSQDHLLVSQTECRVEHYVRQGDNGWLLTDHPKIDDRLTLQSIDCSLSLREIYERAEWPIRADRA